MREKVDAVIHKWMTEILLPNEKLTNIMTWNLSQILAQAYREGELTG